MNEHIWNNLTVVGKSQQWQRMTPAEKDQFRSDAGLTRDLIGLEGWRIEARYPDGSKRRFYVGRSSGWQPCHIELMLRTSNGGGGVYWPDGTTFVKLYRKEDRR